MANRLFIKFITRVFVLTSTTLVLLFMTYHYIDFSQNINFIFAIVVFFMALILWFVYSFTNEFSSKHYQQNIEDSKSKLYTDKLTSLNNRRYFDKVLEDLMEHSKESFALLMFDVDDFKTINDTYGHTQGDEVLANLSILLKSNIRSNDLLFRWGGDEFFLIIKSSSEENSLHIAQKLRNKILESQLHSKYGVTLSFGVTLKKDLDTMDTLIQRADKALYESKLNGKNKSTLL